ncbi:MAG TPA: thioredoxin family protein [Kofleriaceae bacterium]
MTASPIVGRLAAGAIVVGIAACSPAGPLPTADAVTWTATLPGDPRTLDDLLAIARAAHQPVWIELTAAWCAACRIVDQGAYRDPDVVRAARRFLTIRIDTTAGDPLTTALATRLAATGLPTLMFVGADGTPLADRRVVGTIAAPELVATLAEVR